MPSFFTVLLCLVLSPVVTRAADVGHIAVVEDENNAINGALLPNIYVAKAACAFFKEHDDRYDALFVFSSVMPNLMNTSPMGWTVKQMIKGIGKDLGTNQSAAFCSTNGTLRHVVRLGHIDGLPDDTEALYPHLPDYGLSSIAVLAHEFGHYWLVAPRYDKGDGVKHCRLRNLLPDADNSTNVCDGFSNGDWGNHWSYFFNTGSVMYGNAIKDLGNGTFEIFHTLHRYSPLDQYIMGLRHPADVPPTFVVDPGLTALTASGEFPVPPAKTETVTGTRIDIAVDDVIRAEGPRVPPTDPCHWTGAFMLVHPTGKPPTAAQIAKVDAYRTRWETFYAWATDNRGSFDTTLDSSGQSTCLGADTPADAGVEDASAVDGGVSDAGPDGSEPDLIPADGGSGGIDGTTSDSGDDGGCSCTASSGARTRSGWPFGLLICCLLLLLASRREGA